MASPVTRLTLSFVLGGSLACGCVATDDPSSPVDARSDARPPGAPCTDEQPFGTKERTGVADFPSDLDAFFHELTVVFLDNPSYVQSQVMTATRLSRDARFRNPRALGRPQDGLHPISLLPMV